jgi:hypothetical protein
VTYKRVWYRTGKKRGLVGASMTGELTVTVSELTLVTRKRQVVIPMSALRTISFGRMRGDVDTFWIVLEVVRDDTTQLVGLRDGRKFGYGQKTEEIYDGILERVRQAGAAQYDVPEGYRTYDRLDEQFTLAIPVGWRSYARSLVETGGRAPWGEIVFLPESMTPGDEPSPDERQRIWRQALEEADDGSAGALFVDRREAVRGMRCEGFSEKAAARLLEWAAEDPLFEAGRGSEESTRTEPLVIDDCSGLRIVRRSRRAGEEERVLDLRAVSDDETVYLFGLRSRAGRHEREVEMLDTAARSVRFSVARN